jgi:hypothetical protein
MQSARRASEIHELRTGRALRVTETEVVNEEMYEEITAVSTDRHLWRADWNTRSDDFDRRLLAYLTSQRSNRGALDHTLPGSWKEQRPDSAAFVDPDVLQGASFPQHMTDVTRRNSRHTPYPSASWELQPRNHAYQPVMPFNDYNFNQQFMGPPQSPWSDSSRRMSLPTTAFAPRPYQSPTWTSTPPSDYPPSPLQRSDSAIDQPDGLNPIQQPDPKNQWQASKLAASLSTTQDTRPRVQLPPPPHPNTTSPTVATPTTPMESPRQHPAPRSNNHQASHTRHTCLGTRRCKHRLPCCLATAVPISRRSQLIPARASRFLVAISAIWDCTGLLRRGFELLEAMIEI